MHNSLSKELEKAKQGNYFQVISSNSKFRKKITAFIKLAPFRDETKKAAPTSFSPITSLKIGISPQNFLTFPLV